MSQERISYTQWLKRGNNRFFPSDNSKTVAELDAGVYSIEEDPQIGIYVVKKDLKLDEIYHLPSDEMKSVINGVDSFFKNRQTYIKNGFTHKRGYLLYGAPGNGKSSVINVICNSVINELNGVCFTITTYNELDRYKRFVQTVFRYIQPETPVVTILEDIDGICETYGAETLLINILDGIEQTDNVLYLATTNFPEKLSQRLVNRPNRFDRKVEIGSPNEKSRCLYLTKKLASFGCDENIVQDISKRTEGFSMAQLQEVVKSFVLLGMEIGDAIKEVRGLSNIKNSSSFSPQSNGVGFKASATPDHVTGVKYFIEKGKIHYTNSL